MILMFPREANFPKRRWFSLISYISFISLLLSFCDSPARLRLPRPSVARGGRQVPTIVVFKIDKGGAWAAREGGYLIMSFTKYEKKNKPIMLKLCIFIKYWHDQLKCKHDILQ